MKVKFYLKVSQYESVEDVLKALDELDKKTKADLEVELDINRGLSPDGNLMTAVEKLKKVQKE